MALSACNEEADNISNNSYHELTDADFLPGSANINANSPTIDPAVSRLEFPHIKESGTQVLVNRTGETVNYCVEWDTEKMSQRYSCYQMDAQLGAKRTSRYYPSGGELQYPFDDRIATYFNHADPFYSTGYDHGHICPSADRLYSAAANKQTFLHVFPYACIESVDLWLHVGQEEGLLVGCRRSTDSMQAYGKTWRNRYANGTWQDSARSSTSVRVAPSRIPTTCPTPTRRWLVRVAS